jgi:hypothetical protein
MTTEKNQISKPEVEMESMYEYIIRIKLGDDRILIETMSYLGTRFACVSIRDKRCVPWIRVAVPLWVWRRVRRMIRSGNVDDVVNNFLKQVVKEFIIINVSDRALGKPNYDRIYYEEPYRLLSFF